MFAIEILISFQCSNILLIPKCDHIQWVSLKLALQDDISKTFSCYNVPIKLIL